MSTQILKPTKFCRLCSGESREVVSSITPPPRQGRSSSNKLAMTSSLKRSCKKTFQYILGRTDTVLNRTKTLCRLAYKFELYQIYKRNIPSLRKSSGMKRSHTFKSRQIAALVSQALNLQTDSPLLLPVTPGPGFVVGGAWSSHLQVVALRYFFSDLHISTAVWVQTQPQAW